MQKPYIICHMMMAADGRIDCSMTEKINGVDEYYLTLNALNTPSTVSGRVTAQLEMAQGGSFSLSDGFPYGKEDFRKNADAKGYEIIVDTKGTLLWDDGDTDKPYLIIMSEDVSEKYLDYLNSKKISWITCGKAHIDLRRASEILAENFRIERMAIVGGGHINGSFLDEGLVDEVSLLIGPAIDGREGMTAVFDGRRKDREPIHMLLKDIQKFEDGAVWLRYEVKNGGGK
uniref:Pyrimidine reductase, riboflavin biosynthesis n=1 Tax=Eubacterium cellulosolvens (strain ATCC 43171 / JCM 9499 / 6) TaxID=633697 RepID=I5AX83_EUBC6